MSMPQLNAVCSVWTTEVRFLMFLFLSRVVVKYECFFFFFWDLASRFIQHGGGVALSCHSDKILTWYVFLISYIVSWHARAPPRHPHDSNEIFFPGAVQMPRGKDSRVSEQQYNIHTGSRL